MKRMLLATVTATIALLGVATAAQAPTSGRTASETKVLERALDFWRNVFTPLKLDRFKDYIAADYVEHFPGMENGGLQQLLNFFGPVAKQSPHGLPPAEPVLQVVDGDITLLLVPRPGTEGKEQLRIEVQRWKDGKQIEHWDGDAIKSTPAAPSVKARSALEQKNLDFVVNFWHSVLEPLKTGEFGKYITPDYIEHDAAIPQGGLSALQQYISGLRKDNPNGLPRMTFVHMLVDGDLVVLTHVKDAGPDPKDPSKQQQILGLDVLRVTNGKMVEHWGDSRFAKAPG